MMDNENIKKWYEKYRAITDEWEQGNRDLHTFLKEHFPDGKFVYKDLSEENRQKFGDLIEPLICFYDGIYRYNKYIEDKAEANLKFIEHFYNMYTKGVSEDGN